MGTPESAVPALDAILSSGDDVPLVVTQPDRPAGRSKALQPPPVKSFSLAHGLPVIQPDKVRTAAFFEAIRSADADALAVVAFGRILPRTVLDASRHGAVNVHFSLLPQLRGAAPVQWALARGESETGVTVFRLDEGLDTGPILGQRRTAILPDEHAPALLARLADVGAALLVETLRALGAGTVTETVQDHARATSAPILERRHGTWDPAWRALELEGRVRGFDPWPGVWAARAGKRLRVVACRAIPAEVVEAVSGAVLSVDGSGIRVACAGGTVAMVDSVQPAGGRVMRARDAVSGRLLAPGDRLERPEPAA